MIIGIACMASACIAAGNQHESLSCADGVISDVGSSRFDELPGGHATVGPPARELQLGPVTILPAGLARSADSTQAPAHIYKVGLIVAPGAAAVLRTQGSPDDFVWLVYGQGGESRSGQAATVATGALSLPACADGAGFPGEWIVASGHDCVGVQVESSGLTHTGLVGLRANAGCESSR